MYGVLLLTSVMPEERSESAKTEKLRQSKSTETPIRIDESMALIAPTRKEVSFFFFPLLTLFDSHKYAVEK